MEEFELLLSNPMNGTLGNPIVAKVMIFDDDSDNTRGGAGMSFVLKRVFLFCHVFSDIT